MARNPHALICNGTLQKSLAAIPGIRIPHRGIEVRGVEAQGGGGDVARLYSSENCVDIVGDALIQFDQVEGIGQHRRHRTGHKGVRVTIKATPCERIATCAVPSAASRYCGKPIPDREQQHHILKVSRFVWVLLVINVMVLAGLPYTLGRVEWSRPSFYR